MAGERGAGGTERSGWLSPWRFGLLAGRVIHELGWAAGLALLALMTALFALGLRRCMRQRGMLGRLLSTAALTTLVLETVCFVVYDLGFPLAAPRWCSPSCPPAGGIWWSICCCWG